jgi:hypothetical protein
VSVGNCRTVRILATSFNPEATSSIARGLLAPATQVTTVATTTTYRTRTVHVVFLAPTMIIPVTTLCASDLVVQLTLARKFKRKPRPFGDETQEREGEGGERWRRSRT